LEKDVWVVATPRALFEAPFVGHLTFKEGTSLSKAWCAVRRFSEDFDITRDIRARCRIWLTTSATRHEPTRPRE